MKLSDYAKKLGVTYKTAWNWFKAGSIEGAYQLPSGTVSVPEKLKILLIMELFYMLELVPLKIKIS